MKTQQRIGGQCHSKPLSALRMSVCLLLLTCAGVSAEVKLPAVIDSHMVLQRNAPLPVWGWASAGEQVTVTLDKSSAETEADADGRWSVTLPPMKADGKAHSMKIIGNNTIELENILIGEVWVGSGQSNMEWRLSSTHGAKDAISAADYQNIRLFHVPKVQKPKPSDDVKAKWKVCTPSTVPSFSAVLYYYGKKLHEELGVPIGLINSSWGGSPIEPWTTVGGKSGGMYNGMIAPLQPFAV
ncbi:MAG: hypothetical protein IH991_10865 [Planctomycetes bacterium]|nr:hypothetical protein [Planctomycetota bacterium]